MVKIESNPDMIFAGSNDACAHLYLKSLGLPEDSTAEYSQILCGFMEQHFGVSPGRTYIEFVSPPRHMFGWNNAITPGVAEFMKPASSS